MMSEKEAATLVVGVAVVWVIAMTLTLLLVAPR